ncbi:ethanolamine ammonia-lyase subunit EutC [Janthinobacterium sp. PC23-8]|uniref:ethanolamine ammonia-lyase subunit EutC n=1 Tax=Janthinobacterium sp. PC23-8 TaxID=2012679 RepID=UPI000B961B39|nr:ethanolamine ammonia-lyase subunit EutC [Janthinobacterium sp. PC23-8]OYO28870.1 ethanolamine ammonia-lyase [Janthinobacterium sp. PC23-8]
MNDTENKIVAGHVPQDAAEGADANPDADESGNGLVTANPWQSLRRFTAARIALGRCGVSQPTAPQLAFQLAHARARDAVHLALDPAALADALQAACALPCLSLHSAAPGRDIYLQRPDLGRRLDDASRQALLQRPAAPAAGHDLAIVIADGLSALAIEQNAAPFLRALMARLAADNWTLAPLAIVAQGRVAVGDEVGELLGARAVLVLIGERPGLSSPDSMGLYLTWAPKTGLTDASRNCISNVRPAGLSYDEAAFKLHYLLTEARKRQLSGVALKDETASDNNPLDAPRRNFLLDHD